MSQSFIEPILDAGNIKHTKGYGMNVVTYTFENGSSVEEYHAEGHIGVIFETPDPRIAASITHVVDEDAEIAKAFLRAIGVSV